MAVIYTRGRALKKAFTALFVVVAGASLLTMALQLLMAASGGSQPDLGWGVVAGVSTGLAVWATRSQGCCGCCRMPIHGPIRAAPVRCGVCWRLWFCWLSA